jgi:prolyl-tRNA editing enzyme YbaK/EbsC (Cys-tRNA(Pro) deacylase)
MMVSPSWITDMLERRGVAYELLHTCAELMTRQMPHGAHKSQDCLASVVMIIADGRPVQLILPAGRRVVLAQARKLLAADSIRLASEMEMERFFSDCESRSIPPLRRWKGVTVLMDYSMASSQNLLFPAGGNEHMIRLRFEDWFGLVSPGVAFFTEAGLALRLTTGPPSASFVFSDAGA